MVENSILSERQLRALQLRKEGYNCCQAVVLAFPELTEEAAAKFTAAISSAFGSGVGGRGEICGAASGLAMLAGLSDWHDTADKKVVYDTTMQLLDKFTERNGALRCRELKRSGAVRTCPMLITDAVGIMAEHLGLE